MLMRWLFGAVCLGGIVVVLAGLGGCELMGTALCVAEEVHAGRDLVAAAANCGCSTEEVDSADVNRLPLDERLCEWTGDALLDEAGDAVEAAAVCACRYVVRYTP